MQKSRSISTSPPVIPVILCGGSGTRLWPVSDEYHPKQFLKLLGEFSLLQNTALRAIRISGAAPESVVTVTTVKLLEEVRRHMEDAHPDLARHIVCEPFARNTAAAVALAATYVERNFGADALMWILPADHHIARENALKESFSQGLSLAAQDFLVTFGIRPTRPDTGYGYIRAGEALDGGAGYAAQAFIEKPNFETARALAAEGLLWNSGMFLFRTGAALTQFRLHAPEISQSLARYESMPETSFDKAVMEKSERVAVIPCDPGWSDVGSWESLWEIKPKDSQGNVIEGEARCHDASGCLILSRNKLIACAGLENIVVVETDDAILIADRRNPEALRALTQSMRGGA